MHVEIDPGGDRVARLPSVDAGGEAIGVVEPEQDERAEERARGTGRASRTAARRLEIARANHSAKLNIGLATAPITPIEIAVASPNPSANSSRLDVASEHDQAGPAEHHDRGADELGDSRPVPGAIMRGVVAGRGPERGVPERGARNLKR